MTPRARSAFDESRSCRWTSSPRPVGCATAAPAPARAGWAGGCTSTHVQARDQEAVHWDLGDCPGVFLWAIRTEDGVQVQVTASGRSHLRAGFIFDVSAPLRCRRARPRFFRPAGARTFPPAAPGPRVAPRRDRGSQLGSPGATSRRPPARPGTPRPRRVGPRRSPGSVPRRAPRSSSPSPRPPDGGASAPASGGRR